MTKQFKNDFYKNLENDVEDGVLDNRTDLEKRRDELKKSIDELESDVIKDPRALENLKKELASVEKEINKQEIEKAVKNGEVVGKGAAEKDEDEQMKKEEEKQEEVKDENSLNEDEKNKENEEKLKQVYHDAMISYYEAKLSSIRSQKERDALVISDADFHKELELEAAMYTARDAYLALGKEDPYREKRTQLIKQEKEAKEAIEMQLRNIAKRFNEIEQEIKKIDQREQEINEELMKEDIHESQKVTLIKEQEELGKTREKLETERADIREKLNSAINIRRQRTLQRVGLEEKHVETLRYEDKKNYDYQQEKVSTMYKNFDEATKQHYKNIKIRIEQREQRIKDINKELKEIPDTDFERRLILLNELDKESNMLVADREAKSDLDRGIIPNAVEAKREAKEKIDEEEYRQEEFDKATDDARTVVEEQKEKIGEAVVKTPEEVNMEEKDRDTTLVAATVAVAYDSPKPGPDTPLDDLGQFAVAKCVISGLEDKVRNPEKLEDAKAMVAHDEQLKEADDQLDKVQENIEDKIQK